jgi:hypothetical protein
LVRSTLIGEAVESSPEVHLPSTRPDASKSENCTEDSDACCCDTSSNWKPGVPGLMVIRNRSVGFSESRLPMTPK